MIKEFLSSAAQSNIVAHTSDILRADLLRALNIVEGEYAIWPERVSFPGVVDYSLQKFLMDEMESMYYF